MPTAAGLVAHQNFQSLFQLKVFKWFDIRMVLTSLDHLKNKIILIKNLLSNNMVSRVIWRTI